MNIFHKHLHICEKSSTFVPAFGKLVYTILYYPLPSYTTLHDAFAIVAQLVEQRIRNAWVAGLETEN